MAFPTFPTQPDPWPVRTQDQETFDTAVAGTFNFYDELETWAAGFESEADTLAGALVAANLPSLTGQAGKVPFVNADGDAVEMDNPVIFETASASSLGKVGDTGTSTYADAISDTITLGASKVHTVFQVGLMKFRATSSSSVAFIGRLSFNGVAQGISLLDGVVNDTGDIALVTTFSALRTTSTGSLASALEVQCDTNVEIDRAKIITIAMRSA